MKKLLIIVLTLAFFQVFAAAPDEAVGRVVTVLSGDSFGIEIKEPDPRTLHIDRVVLADIISPSTLTSDGKKAKKYAASILKNKTVYLDIDDSSSGGRNYVGQLVCVVYLMDDNGRPIWPCLNRIIVDSGHAEVNDTKDNEFDPTTWWQKPPDMKISRPRLTEESRRETPRITEEREEATQANETSVLMIDPNSSLVSIGYRRN